MMVTELPAIPDAGLSHEMTGTGKSTVRATVVLETRVPVGLVPVIVTVAAPTVAVLLAVRVNTLVEVAGLVPNAAVTPAGRPDAERVKLPVNGLTSVIVTVSVPDPPWVIARVDAEAASVKLPVACAGALQVVPLIENDAGIWLLTPFQTPLNPMLVAKAPGDTAPL
jgi:hypothetical protein